MNQAICIRGVEGAEMAFFGFWSHPVYIPVISDYTERVELNAGLKMCVRVHLRLGMNQRSRHVLTALNRLVRDFEGTPNSGISVRPPSGLMFVVPGAVASSFFRASSSTIPITNLVWYERQTPLVAHSPRVARGAPPSSRRACQPLSLRYTPTTTKAVATTPDLFHRHRRRRRRRRRPVDAVPTYAHSTQRGTHVNSGEKC